MWLYDIWIKLLDCALMFLYIYSVLTVLTNTYFFYDFLQYFPKKQALVSS